MNLVSGWSIDHAVIKSRNDKIAIGRVGELISQGYEPFSVSSDRTGHGYIMWFRKPVISQEFEEAMVDALCREYGWEHDEDRDNAYNTVNTLKPVIIKCLQGR